MEKSGKSADRAKSSEEERIPPRENKGSNVLLSTFFHTITEICS